MSSAWKHERARPQPHSMPISLEAWAIGASPASWHSKRQRAGRRCGRICCSWGWANELLAAAQAVLVSPLASAGLRTLRWVDDEDSPPRYAPGLSRLPLCPAGCGEECQGPELPPDEGS